MKFPENTKNKLHIMSPKTLLEVNDSILEHFGELNNDFEISSEEIQIDCFGYDAYDPSDYANFIIIERKI
jgi:hypothetical protein